MSVYMKNDGAKYSFISLSSFLKGKKIFGLKFTSP